MKRFLTYFIVAVLAAVAAVFVTRKDENAPIRTETPERPAGQEDVTDFHLTWMFMTLQSGVR